MENTKKYNIGLDIGTSSVGWAVVEIGSQKILKKGKKALWGVRLFEEAQKAEKRRSFRSTRRRYDRRRERISLLRKEFEQEINTIDPNFFKKLDESKYIEDDINNKTIQISKKEKEQLKNYLREYPTIYHLRKRLIENKEKEDIRLIYLAIHHIIKYRGNFLYNTKSFNANNLNLEERIEESFNTYFNYIGNDYDDYKDIINIKELSEALMLENKSDVKAETKRILTESTIFDKNFISEFVKLIVGNKFNINKLLQIEDADKKIDINFDGTDLEDKYDDIEELADEKIEILESMKELYDTLFLKRLFKGSNDTNISSLMVNKYVEHKKDLMFLKSILRSNKKAFKEFFKSKNNYKCLYEKYISNNSTEKLIYDDFIKKIDNAISNTEINDYNLSNKYITEIKPKMNNGNFIPKITSTENGKYPYQLNKDELIKIIENQGIYYPFLLNKTNDGTYKIVKLLEFRIPYFVGPLVNDNQSRYAWMERNIENVKITPYNFDEVINKELTAEKFIKRMIKHCTYLLEENALPNNSIRYNNFKVLNELKQIKINDDSLDINLQHKILEELFKVKGTVSEKIFKDYLLENNEYPMHGTELNITGYSGDGKFANNMQSYVDFFGNNGIFENTDYTEDDAENIIEWITIFDDKDILEQKVRNSYPKLADLKIKTILSKKYKGWGSLSSKLLNTKYYLNKKTNTKKSILDIMYESKENFMQILNNNKYKFQNMIKEFNNIDNKLDKLSYNVVEPLATSPANKRGIYQALKIVEEITDYMGYDPKNIIVEMAREDGKKERKDDKKKYIENLYNKSKEQIEDYNKLQVELKKEEINSQKMFLYFIQEGKCLYCHKPLNIEDLKDYEIDHIIPRTLIKDDSIDNKALVHKQCNQDKAASYILPESYRNIKNREWWKHLKGINLISAKKYNNLIRKEYSEEDIKGFINRQLVETRQITKHVANILNTYYKNTKIIYLKAKISHDYRDKYKLYKFREINDYHHAHDAYLAAVLGEYNENYLKKNINFEIIKGLNNHLRETDNKDKIKYGYVINSLESEVYDYLMNQNITIDNETGEVIETEENNEVKKIDVSLFNKIVENTLYRNDILVSRKTEIKTGKLFKETIYKKGKGKISIKKNLPIEIYGGYLNMETSFLVLVKYNNKTKLVGIPIEIALKVKKGKNELKNFLESHLKTKNIEIINDKIPYETLIFIKDQPIYIKGYSVQKRTCELSNALQFKIKKENMIKWKYALNRLFNDNKNINEYSDELYIKNLKNIENELYETKTQYPLFKNAIQQIEDNFKEKELKIEDYETIIRELFKLYHCGSEKVDLSKYGLGDRIGRLSGINISKGTIVSSSCSGIKRKEYEF
mgnify:CR=1 FL=1